MLPAVRVDGELLFGRLLIHTVRRRRKRIVKSENRENCGNEGGITSCGDTSSAR